MSTTQMLTGDANTVKLWSVKSWIQSMRQSHLGDLFDNGAIYYPEEESVNRKKGDLITYDFINRMTGVPRGEGQAVVGNEKALDIGNFTILINESADAVKFKNTGIEPQRTNIKFEEVVNQLIPKRCAELVETSFFQQLAGVNPTSFVADGTTYASTADKLHVQGHNTPVAPTTNRVLRAGGVSADESLTSSNTFKLNLIDYALELNDSSTQPIQPLDDGHFRLYISQYDYVNLKNDAGSTIQWSQINLAKLMGGDESNIESRFNAKYGKMVTAGVYQNVVICVSPRVAFGANSSTSAVITTTRRNVLVGKNAATFASPYGGRMQDENVPLRIINELQDYGRYKGVGFELLYGLKKNVPSNGEDIGSMVIGTYAAAHT